MADDPNGSVYVEDVEENGPRAKGSRQKETLYSVLHHLIAEILSPHSGSGGASTPLLHRIKASVAKNAPLLPEASRNSATNIRLWARRGSPLRALLVISVGSIALLALTGLLILRFSFWWQLSMPLLSLLSCHWQLQEDSWLFSLFVWQLYILEHYLWLPLSSLLLHFSRS